MTQFTYDLAGNLLIETDATGRVTTRTYDSLGRLFMTTLPDPDGAGPQLAFGMYFLYDAVGNLVIELNGEFEFTYHIYDSLGRLTRTLEPIASGRDAETLTSYDAVGNRTSTRDANFNTTSYFYDQLNRVIRETATVASTSGPNDPVTRHYVYLQNGNYSAFDRNRGSDSKGRRRQVFHDLFGRVVEEKWYKNESDQSLHRLQERTWSYDELGRLSGTTAGTWDTDPMFPNTTVVWHEEEFEYDNLGRLLLQASWDPADAADTRVELSYEYDAAPTLAGDADFLATTVTQTVGPTEREFTTTRTYDRLGRLVESDDSIVTKELEFHYDAADRLTGIERTWSILGEGSPAPPPVVHHFDTAQAYDGAGRLGSKSHYYPGAARELARYDYSYDNASRIIAVESQHNWQVTTDDLIPTTYYSRLWGIDTYTYDDAGRLSGWAAEVDDAVPGFGQDLAHTAGDAAALDDGGNRTADQTTGAGNRLTSGADEVFEYDKEGNLARRTALATGAATVYGWDNRNQLTSATTVNQTSRLVDFTTTVAYAGETGTGTYQSASAGRELALSGNVWRAVALPASWTVTANTYLEFDYRSTAEGMAQGIGFDVDSTSGNGPQYLFQLQGTEPAGTGTHIIPDEYEAADGWRHYKIKVTDFLASGYQFSRLLFANNDDIPVGGASDSQFKNVLLYNRVEADSGSSGSLRFRYDNQGQLVAQGVVAAGGVTTITERYTYENGQRVLTTDSAGNILHRYHYAPGVDALLADEVFGSGGDFEEIYWTATDHLGSVRDVLDQDGVLANHLEYDEHGVITRVVDEYKEDVAVSDRAVDVAFGGKDFVDELGFYYNRARFYDAKNERFISEDPIAADENLYRYAENDPVNYADPSGLSSQSVFNTLAALKPPIFASGGANPYNVAPALANFSLGGSSIPSLYTNLGSGMGTSFATSLGTSFNTSFGTSFGTSFDTSFGTSFGSSFGLGTPSASDIASYFMGQSTGQSLFAPSFEPSPTVHQLITGTPSLRTPSAAELAEMRAGANHLAQAGEFRPVSQQEIDDSRYRHLSQQALRTDQESLFVRQYEAKAIANDPTARFDYAMTVLASFGGGYIPQQAQPQIFARRGEGAIPNPYGRLGSPEHRATVAARAVELQGQGYTIIGGGGLAKERSVQTATGRRYPDITAIDSSNRPYYENVGRTTGAGNPVARERRVLDDIESATGQRPVFTPYDR